MFSSVGPRAAPVQGAPVAVNLAREQHIERLVPSVEEISNSMCPEIERGLLAHGLQADPSTIRDNLVEAIKLDQGLPVDKLTQFPILAGFVALGLITHKQRNQIMTQQAQIKKDGGHKLVGDILQDELRDGRMERPGFNGQDSYNAANALLTRLQSPINQGQT